MSEVEPLKVFFFSDWRIQPLELAEDLIRSVAPLDLIIYGGDDVSRFVPVTDIAQTMNIDRHTLDSEIMPKDIENVIRALQEELGREPLDVPRDEPLTLAEVYGLFRDPTKDNWLSKIASYTRYGVLGVVGNDCRPYHRAFLNVPDVHDIHASPAVIGGWGFVGIEGSIYRGATNCIGHVLHADDEVGEHLTRAVENLAISSDRLVIVSHTPPAGCQLDYAIRFGFDRLGSETLREFVLQRQPALVLSGHCHSCGGKSALMGQTLVVNGASDDTRLRGTRAAVIELIPDELPRIEWLDAMQFSPPVIPDVGPLRAQKLQSCGITSPEQLLAAPADVHKAIQFGPIRLERLRAYVQARVTDEPVWLQKLDLPEKLLFYDVETGLNIDGLFGLPQEPWMIAISDGNDLTQWIVAKENRKARKAMYEGFLNYLHQYPDRVLCSYSGFGFDDRAVEVGLSRWFRKGLDAWAKVPKIDLLQRLRKCLALPTWQWSLKHVAKRFGYTFSQSDLNGFEVGLLYEAYRHFNEPLPIEAIARYNAEDVTALVFVAQWAQRHGAELSGGSTSARRQAGQKLSN